MWLGLHNLLHLTYCFCFHPTVYSLFVKSSKNSCVSSKLFLGDASYCTPEQYKDCAEPALGKSEVKAAHTHTHTHTVYFLVYI